MKYMDKGYVGFNADDFAHYVHRRCLDLIKDKDKPITVTIQFTCEYRCNSDDNDDLKMWNFDISFYPTGVICLTISSKKDDDWISFSSKDKDLLDKIRQTLCAFQDPYNNECAKFYIESNENIYLCEFKQESYKQIPIYATSYKDACEVAERMKDTVDFDAFWSELSFKIM